MPKKFNVISIKWGTLYNAEDANKLCSAVKRNTSCDIDFYCFTDDGRGLSPDIIVKPLPVLNVAPEYKRHVYPRTAGFGDVALGGLTGQRVFYFDLDSLIVGNLDALFDYPQGDKFYIINDWKHRRGPKKDKVGQGSCYSFVVGTLEFLKSNFEADPKGVLATYGTASQQYMSAQVIAHYGALNFWPDDWFKSFRFHCMRNCVARWFLAPKKPDIPALKVIAFHGSTNIRDAIEGVWGKGRSAPHGWKKIYKHVRPSPWVLDYWK